MTKSENPIVAHIDNVQPVFFPGDPVRMAQTDSRIALPFSEDGGHFMSGCIHAANSPIFIIGDIDIVRVIDAQVLG